MTQVAVSHKLLTVTMNIDGGWTYVTDQSKLGLGILPTHLLVLGTSDTMFGPRRAVTFDGATVAYCYPSEQGSELLVLNE